MFNPNLLLAYIQKIGGIDKLQKRYHLLLASGPHRRNPRLILPMQSHVELGHIPIHLKRPKTDILSDIIQIIPQQEKRGEGGTSTKWNENQEIKNKLLNSIFRRMSKTISKQLDSIHQT